MLTFLSQRSSTLPDRPLLQWSVVVITGIMLGIFTVATAGFSLQTKLMLVAVVLCPFVLMIVGAVKRVLLAIILLEIPLQLDIYLQYRAQVDEMNGLAGFNLSITTICLLLLYLLWVAEVLAKATMPTKAMLRVSRPLLLYIAAISLSIFGAADVELALFELVLLVQALLIYIYLVHDVQSQEDVRFVLTVLLVGLALQGVIMIGLRGLGHSFFIAGISARIDAGVRVGGTVGSPNGAAAYLNLILLPALAVLLIRNKRSMQWLAAVAFSAGAIGLLLTFSRGGWSGFSVALALFGLLVWQRGLLSLNTIISIGVLSGLPLLLLRGEIIKRLISDDNGAGYSRIPLMQLAVQMLQDHWLRGVGANNFAFVLPRYLTPEYNQAWISTVHNKYMLIWTESGLLAIIAFVWFLAATLWHGWQVWNARDPDLSPLALGCMAAVLSQVVHMTVDIFNGRPQVQMLWTIAGLLAAMHQIVQRKSSHFLA